MALERDQGKALAPLAEVRTKKEFRGLRGFAPFAPREAVPSARGSVKIERRSKTDQGQASRPAAEVSTKKEFRDLRGFAAFAPREAAPSAT